MTDKAQWYDNKELFGMINDLKGDLQETRAAVKKYNGLHEKFEKVEKTLEAQTRKCSEIQQAKQVKGDLALTLLKIWPIVISTIMAAWAILGR